MKKNVHRYGKLTPEQKRAIHVALRASGKSQHEVAEILNISQQSASDYDANIRNTRTGNAYDLRLKIPRAQRDVILRRAQAGETQEQIAADYKVSQPSSRRNGGYIKQSGIDRASFTIKA